MLTTDEASDALTATLSAIADPTRRRLLARLSEGEATVSDLATPFAISMPAISRHLRVLAQAGLVDQGRRAQWRPCRLTASPLRAVAQWVNPYQRFWEDQFDRLDAYLLRVQQPPGLPSTSPGVEETP